MKHCRTCTCCDDPLAAELDRLRSWCRERGVAVVRGDLLRLGDASTFSGLAVQTLRNLSSAGELHFERVRGRSYITIETLAALVAGKK